MRRAAAWAVCLVLLAGVACVDAELTEEADTAQSMPGTLADAVMEIGRLKAKLGSAQARRAVAKNEKYCEVGQAAVDLGSDARLPNGQLGDASEAAAVEAFSGGMAAMGAQAAPLVMKLMGPAIAKSVPKKWRKLMKTTTENLLKHKATEFVHKYFHENAADAGVGDCGKWLKPRAKEMTPAFRDGFIGVVDAVAEKKITGAGGAISKAGDMCMGFTLDHAGRVLDRETKQFSSTTAPHIRTFLLEVMRVIMSGGKKEETNQLGASNGKDSDEDIAARKAAIAQMKREKADEAAAAAAYKPEGFAQKFVLAAVMFAQSVLPAMVNAMVENTPEPIRKAKEPVRETVKGLVRDVTGELERYPFPAKAQGHIVEYILSASKEIDQRLGDLTTSLANRVLVRRLQRPVKEMPESIRPILNGVFDAIAKGDPEAAGAKISSSMARFAVGAAETTIKKAATQLPTMAVGAVTTSLDKFAKAFSPEEKGTAEELGESATAAPVVDVKMLLIKEGQKFFFGVIPALLDVLCKNLPPRMQYARVPIENTMTLLAMRLNKILGETEEKWNLEGRKEIANAIMFSVYDLALRLEENEGKGFNPDGTSNQKAADAKAKRDDLANATKAAANNGTKGSNSTARKYAVELVELAEDAPADTAAKEDKKLGKEVDHKEELEQMKSDPSSIVKPLVEKIPAEYRSIFMKTVPLLLNGDTKKASATMQKQLLKYGSKIGLPKVLASGIDELPDMMDRRQILNSIMDIANVYIEALEKGADSSKKDAKPGNAFDDASFTLISTVEVLLKHGTKVMKGVLPGAIAYLADNLPSDMKKAADPLKTTFTDAVVTLLTKAGRPEKWNPVGYTEMAEVIMKAAKELKRPFASAQMFRTRANLLKRVTPLVEKMPPNEQAMILETLQLTAVGDASGAAETMTMHTNKFLLEKIKTVIEKDTKKLPAYASTAVKKVALDIANKDFRGNDARLIGKIVAEDIVKVVGEVIPGLISYMISKVPRRLWKLKRSLKKILTESAATIFSLMNRGATTWNRFTGAKITKAVIGAMKAISKRCGRFVPDEDEDTKEDPSEVDEEYSSMLASRVSLLDLAAAKKEQRKISELIHHLTSGLPVEFSGMIDDAIVALDSDNVDGAMTGLDTSILQYGVSRIESGVKRMTSKMTPFMQDPIYNAFSNVMKEEASQLQAVEEYNSDEGFEVGEGAQDFDPGKMMLQNGILLVGGILPGAIEMMVHGLPRSLRHSKVPVQQQLTEMVKKIMPIIGDGQADWDDEEMGKVVEIIVRTAKKLVEEIRVVKGKLRVMSHIKNEVYSMPKQFIPMFRDPVESLIAGDLHGAVNMLDEHIIRYGMSIISDLVHDFAIKLPEYAAKPVEKAIMTVVKKQGSLMGVDEDLGEAERQGGFVGIATLLIGETVNMLKALLPPLISSMVENLPENLSTQKVPFRTALTNLVNDVTDVLGQGAEMWGEKGANEVAVLLIKHAKFISRATSPVADQATDAAAGGVQETDAKVSVGQESAGNGELGQAAPKPQAEIVASASGGPQLLPRGMTVATPTLGETEVHELGHEESLGESADADGLQPKVSDGASQDPESVIAPLLKQLPHEFRNMLEMTLTKILIKEPEAAAEEIKKGISEYSQSKIDTTVKAMTDRLPRFMRGPANRAITQVVKEQAKEYAGEAPDFDPSKILLAAFVELFRGTMPGMIERMSQQLAFQPAQKVLNKAVEKIVMKVLQILQNGPWTDKAKVEIMETITAGSNTLLEEVKLAMGGSDKKGSDEAERVFRLLLD